MQAGTGCSGSGRPAPGPVRGWAVGVERGGKIFLIIDVADHTPSYAVFSKLIAQGLGEKRRFTPIVEWSEVEKMATPPS